MAFLCDFPTPPVTREAFAGGFSDKGTALLTLDELEQYSSGKGARTERLYKCPFCGASERAFHVNTETGAFNCKRSSCGVRGRLREFWTALDSQGNAGNRTRLRGRKSAFTLSPELVFQPTEGGNWREQWESALPLVADGANAGCDYLCGRGVSIEAATLAGVRFCRNWAPSADGKIYRGGAAVLFPLLDRQGDVVAAGGRYFEPESESPKARTGGDASQGVFHAPTPDVPNPLEWEQPVLVEGPIDALALATCGAPAMSANGVSLPAWLPRAMAFKAPFLCPDGDDAGEAALIVWRREIGPFAPQLRVLRPDGFKDFGECIERDGAATLRSFLIRAGVLPPSFDSELHHLAQAILDSKRTDGSGFDFGKLRPLWRAVCDIEGREMTSQEVAAWAQGQISLDFHVK